MKKIKIIKKERKYILKAPNKCYDKLYSKNWHKLFLQLLIILILFYFFLKIINYKNINIEQKSQSLSNNTQVKNNKTETIYNKTIIENLTLNRNNKIEINYSNYIDNSFSKETIFEAAEKAHDFISNISKGILFSPIPLIIDIPKISVVIPVYNSENTILRTIRSIQNQNFTEFEIILVNDFSTDKSFEIINNLKKEDKRIKIINNKKNMGILYSRSIGCLTSGGKYILPLDNDDMLLNKDIIYIIYNEINNNNYDIVYFRGINAWHFNEFLKKKNIMPFRSFKKNKILIQPELGAYAEKRFVLWGQCIKSELYKKSINSLGQERYSRYITFYEDSIINYINNQFAEIAKLFLKFGILHIIKPWTASSRIKESNKIKYEMYFIETLFEYSKNTIKDKKIVSKKIINMLDNPHFNKTLNDEKAKNFFALLLKKILSSEYIQDKKKEIIKKKSLNFNI